MKAKLFSNRGSGREIPPESTVKTRSMKSVESFFRPAEEPVDGAYFSGATPTLPLMSALDPRFSASELRLP